MSKLEKEKLVQLANMFDLADAIEILTDYSVIHHPDMPQIAPVEAHGLQEDIKKISLNDTFDYHARRNTFLHEMCHVYDISNHLGLKEKGVRGLANLIDHRLYNMEIYKEPETNSNQSRIEKIAVHYDLRDLVDTLVENSLLHIPLPTGNPQEIRYSLWEPWTKMIYININASYHKRRRAIIFEMVDVHNFDNHLELSTEEMQKITDMLDKRLFKREYG